MKEFIEKLIGRLEKITTLYCDDDGCMHYVLPKSWAFQIIRQQAKIYNNGWIHCSERLPEKGGSYIVCSKTGSVYLAHYYKNSVVPHWSKNSGNIIAWMPLPAPYQPKGE